MPAQQYEHITTREVIGMYFQQAELYSAASWVDKIANRFTSNQASETYAGLGATPRMREWLGGKQAKSFREQSLTITNKDFEATVGIKIKDHRRDKTGFIQQRIGQLAESALGHDAELLSTLILAGTGTTVASCYDGKPLWANDHSVGESGTINNNISVDISAAPTETHGTTTDPSPGEMAHAIFDGIKTLFTFKDDQGRPINQNASQFLIMVPVGLMKAAQLAKAQRTLTGYEENPLMASGFNLEIVVNPWLTWNNQLAVFRTDSMSKPFIIQSEVDSTFKVLGEGSDHAFKNNEYLYSVEKAGNIGCGAFDKTVLVTLT